MFLEGQEFTRGTILRGARIAVLLSLTGSLGLRVPGIYMTEKLEGRESLLREFE